MPLSSLLRPIEPLGPADQSHIHDPLDAAALLDGVPPFTRAFNSGASIIIGRKGSGKTSVISGYRSTAGYGRTHGLLYGSQTANPALVVPIVDWEHFHELVRTVARSASANLPFSGVGSEDFLFPEDLLKIWQEAIWDTILRTFYSYACDLPRFPEGLQAVYNLYSLEDVDVSDIAKKNIPAEAKKLIEAAQSAVIRYIQQKFPNQQCFVLFDSMDKYPIRNPIFSKVVSGFLAAINHFNAKHKEISIILCMPEEVEKFISSQFHNLEKDYVKMYRLSWKPGDLLRIVCHRYRLFVQLYAPDHYDKIANLDFSRRADIQFFLNKLFPYDVTNSMRQGENPIAYITRHTQLQPRHFILIFNKIISKAREASGSIWQFEPEHVRAGVEDIESVIAQHILAPYRLIYPKLITACQDVLPELPPICSLSQLDAVERRFGKGKIEEDIVNPWRTLTEMGILGVIEEQEPHPHLASPRRYHYGAFHFNSTSGFGFSNNRQYCFHPIFSRFFGLRRSKEDSQLAVYPANIGDVNRAGLFFDASDT